MCLLWLLICFNGDGLDLSKGLLCLLSCWLNDCLSRSHSDSCGPLVGLLLSLDSIELCFLCCGFTFSCCDLGIAFGTGNLLLGLGGICGSLVLDLGCFSICLGSLRLRFVVGNFNFGLGFLLGLLTLSLRLLHCSISLSLAFLVVAADLLGDLGVILGLLSI